MIKEETYRKHVEALPTLQQQIVKCFEGSRLPYTTAHLLPKVNDLRRSQGYSPVKETAITPRMRELDERGLALIRECTPADDQYLKTTQGKVKGAARFQRAWVWRGYVTPDRYHGPKDYHDLFIKERAARQRLVRAKNI